MDLQKKMRSDRIVEKFKARLVAKGFSQKQGDRLFWYLYTDHTDDNYQDANYTRCIGWMWRQRAWMVNLTEETYMKQSEGFVVRELEDKVCKMMKSLYWLKQAPKMWHEKFDKIIKSNGYKVIEINMCVYTKFIDGRGVIVYLYIDDGLILATNLESISGTKKFLLSEFSIKDLRDVDVILGIKIIWKEEGIALSQDHYIKKMLTR